MKQTWISDRLDELGRSQAELGRFLKMPAPRISEIISGRRKIQIEELSRLIEFLGMSEAEAMRNISGHEKDAVPGSIAEPTSQKAYSTKPIEFSGEFYTPVPVYDFRASGGSSAAIESSAPIHHFLFRTQSLKMFTNAPPELLAIIQVSGDGMEPTLRQGDDVLIDRRDTRIGTDAMYAYAQADGNELLVKRFQRSAKSKFITIRSDNPNYDIETGVSDDDIKVIGRVIWIGRHIGG